MRKSGKRIPSRNWNLLSRKKD